MRLVGFALVSLLAVLGVACTPKREAAPPLVLAAASLQESLNAAADAWAAQGHVRPVLSFAGSSALARQIESGAGADLFISADEAWMDRLERSGRIRGGTRKDLVANSLVLVEPATADDDTVALVGLAATLGDGRLAMADPEAVPAGRYGKAALQQLGQWDAVADRVAPAENVRAALAMVERGQAPLGIVYATDARASQSVRTVATFPDGSHPPILYPAAVLSTSTSPDARPFLAFLRSPEGQAIFARYGFRAPPG